MEGMDMTADEARIYLYDTVSNCINNFLNVEHAKQHIQQYETMYGASSEQVTKLHADQAYKDLFSDSTSWNEKAMAAEYIRETYPITVTRAVEAPKVVSSVSKIHGKYSLTITDNTKNFIRDGKEY